MVYDKTKSRNQELLEREIFENLIYSSTSNKKEQDFDSLFLRSYSLSQIIRFLKSSPSISSLFQNLQTNFGISIYNLASISTKKEVRIRKLLAQLLFYDKTLAKTLIDREKLKQKMILRKIKGLQTLVSHSYRNFNQKLNRKNKENEAEVNVA